MADIDRSGDITHESRADPRVVAYRLKLVENAVLETTRALTGINASLQALSLLEARHTETRDALARAFAKLEDHERRIAEVELKMPVLILTSSWVRLGVIGLVGLLCVAVVKLILVTH